MDVEANCIVSSDSYEVFGISDKRRASNERVQDFLDRGLMSKDAVYHRYTVLLSQTVTTASPNGPAELENIKQAFYQLQEAGTLSREKFNRIVTSKLSGLALPKSEDSATLLFDIINWNASFPFSTSGVPRIDENAFLRAVCRLTRDPAPRYGPKFTAVTHDVSSGTWGPHSGWLMKTRGKDVNDFSRWLFRSLASLGGTIMSTTKETTIPAPRFIMYQPHQDSDKEPEQQVVVMEKENEKVIDILDVIAECPPEVDRLTANPLRESYGLVLSSLQPQSHDLTDLQVPATKLASLLKLVQAAQAAEKQATIDSLIEKLRGESGLSWEKFDATVSKQAEIVANGLSKVFGIFKAPLEL